MSDWISVDKYLPPFDKDVLCFCKDVCSGEYDIQVCSLSGEKGCWTATKFHMDKRKQLPDLYKLGLYIFYWTPIPEVPEVE